MSKSIFIIQLGLKTRIPMFTPYLEIDGSVLSNFRIAKKILLQNKLERY